MKCPKCFSKEIKPFIEYPENVEEDESKEICSNCGLIFYSFDSIFDDDFYNEK